MFKKVVIAGRSDIEDSIKLAEKVAKFLLEKGLEVTFEDDVASKLGFKGEPLTMVEGDLVITIGGDGTVLRILHCIQNKMPIFAVKMGRIGFFAETTPENVFTDLEKVLNGNFFCEEHFLLKTNLNLPEALNEVRIGTLIPQQMVEVNVLVDELQVAKDRVDAIIISTPLGSTAYALSAGASIVSPDVEAIVITPVCPLSPNFKSYVVPSKSIITVTLENEIDYLILIDGQIRKVFSGKQEIKIWKSEEKISFIRVRKSFYERLKRRLKASSVNF
ncbi:MAG: NAD(+)/NADH kinase [Candidatus Bathyarchaeota archaeon]|nr:NAD(+)/NADH kinase [Candidatus Bathyarchaeota archaeon]